MGTLKQDFTALGMELRETHISQVFLAQDVVYKLKKPVQLGFLDFSTLELRKRYCEAELTLNKRLSSTVYRRVLPVTRDAHGAHALSGAGEIVDYAVEMRRLPDRDAADARLARGQLGPAELAAIAQHLATFHAGAHHDAETERFGQCAAIAENVIENFEQTRQSAREFLEPGELAALERWQREFLTREQPRFEQRIAAGRIRDGHGDLRLEHCYLMGDGAEIIDCIEFNDRFRYGDVCADVAFLAMDLAFHGRRDLAESFLASYAHAADDYELYGVVDFYESYRAYVRGKVSSILAQDESADASARAQAHAVARKYYLLAEACTRESLERPTLYVVGGLMAAGKSSVTRALQALIHSPALAADHVRKRLANAEPTCDWHDEAFSGRYEPASTQQVYRELLRRAAIVLGSGRSVILDASFRERAQRAEVRALAERSGVDFQFIECVAPPDVCRARLRERAKGPSVSDGRLAIFDSFMQSYEAVNELPSELYTQLDTSVSPERTEATLAALVQ